METSPKKGCFRRCFLKLLSKTALFCRSIFASASFSDSTSFQTNVLLLYGNKLCNKTQKEWLRLCISLTGFSPFYSYSDWASSCIQFGDMKNTSQNFVNSNKWKYEELHNNLHEHHPQKHSVLLFLLRWQNIHAFKPNSTIIQTKI